MLRDVTAGSDNVQEHTGSHVAPRFEPPYSVLPLMQVLVEPVLRVGVMQVPSFCTAIALALYGRFVVGAAFVLGFPRLLY
eukprot:3876750-Rhodomonas_salina.1